MSDELNVDPQVLIDAAAGITAVTGTLAGLGIAETASVGRGFAMLELSPMEAGKHEVQVAFEEFVERWTWGVRNLVQAANSIAQVLELNAGRYYELEKTNEDSLKTLVAHTIGNPHLSGDEITDRDWGETLADNAFNHVRNADYSRESFAAAAQQAQTNWQVVEAVAPQALANVGTLPGVGGSGWNTGAAETAAAITAGHDGGR